MKNSDLLALLSFIASIVCLLATFYMLGKM